TQGFRQTTDRTLDVMIEGDGFFTLEMPDGSEAYTRAGNFSLDDEGRLVNANGYYVNGVNGQITEKAKEISIEKDETVHYLDTNNKEQTAGTNAINTLANAGGLSQSGENIWLETNNSGAPEVVNSHIVSGALEMSNVDLSE